MKAGEAESPAFCVGKTSGVTVRTLPKPSARECGRQTANR